MLPAMRVVGPNPGMPQKGKSHGTSNPAGTRGISGVRALPGAATRIEYAADVRDALSIKRMAYTTIAASAGVTGDRV